MDSKINQILKQWPKGTVGTVSWLTEHGVYRQLARRYLSSDWLQLLGRGAYLRAGDSADWFGGLYALQRQQGLSTYVGASTALTLKGLGHYLPLGDKSEVLLFSEHRTTLPAWFRKHDWGVPVRHYCPKLFERSDSSGFTEVKREGFSVRASAPERAILEVLYLAMNNEAIEHAVEIMDGLSTLRPQVLQELLEACRSVKVKRLFLWAAESAGHNWFAKLAVDRVDLGKGKRQLYHGGSFDSKYRITVPKKEGSSRV
ncbi:MAG: type IV toxin-antitoxin system AbiEi family antitoxin domain-containing protein [Kiritimatiellia bacterium]|nr:type IV toxin-antitoxin system AbiEi family antitoxin domain-containing protein [Kiritimatiellia bacterium]